MAAVDMAAVLVAVVSMEVVGSEVVSTAVVMVVSTGETALAAPGVGTADIEADMADSGVPRADSAAAHIPGWVVASVVGARGQAMALHPMLESLMDNGTGSEGSAVEPDSASIARHLSEAGAAAGVIPAGVGAVGA